MALPRSKRIRFQLLLATLGTLLAVTLQPELQPNAARIEVSLGAAAQATSTGGRSGGGSFDAAPAAPPPSQPVNPYPGGAYPGGVPSVPYDYPGVPYDAYPRPYRRPSYPRTYYPDYPTVYPPVVAPAPSVYGGSGDTGVFLLGMFLFLMIAVVLRFASGFSRSGSRSTGTGTTVLDNDRVTLSRVQVALLTQGSTIQADLTQASLAANTSTREGLQALLQEAALALLRMPQNWSHVLVSSETVPRQNAQALFNQLSIAARSKLSAETLVNVGGKISRKAWQPDPDEGPASYVVVTLLVGTADDRPLFGTVHSPADLNTVLTQLASLPAHDLMVFEVIWSPQDAGDTMTRDEFVAAYADMMPI